MAFPGAVVNHSGSCAAEAWAPICAIAVSPSSLAFSSLMTSTAAAPSFSFEALAAVMAPSFSKAGRRVGILSKRAFPGSSSSNTTKGSPFLCGISTGTISESKTPSAWAVWARLYEEIANSSWASRV